MPDKKQGSRLGGNSVEKEKMKTTILYLLLICFCHCSCSSSLIKTNTENNTFNETNSRGTTITYYTSSYPGDETVFYEKENRGEITIFSEKQFNDTVDALVIDTTSRTINVYTESFERDKNNFLEKKHLDGIGVAIDRGVRVSQQTLDMIERDGGIANIMSRILSKENFDKLENRSSVSINVTMSLGESIVTGYSFSIRSINIKELNLSQEEIDKFYNYFKKVTFTYSGDKFKEEIVPVGYTFMIRK